MRLFLSIILFTLGFTVNAKSHSGVIKPLGWYEDTLVSLSKIILNGETDSIKYTANNQFRSLFKEALEQDGAFLYPFDSLTTIAKLTAPDNQFRIFNWHVRRSNITYEYFGFILYHNQVKNRYYIHELTDQSEAIVRPQYAKRLDKDNWYGCHYYSIVAQSKKNNFYVLLGWDGNYYNMNRKIIETVRFNSRGEPMFGGGKLSTPRGTKERFFLQYSSLASVSLRYDNHLKKIVFDYLVPPHPGMRGRYEKYRPSGFYSAFNFENNRWRYEHDIDARDKNLKNKKYNMKKLQKENIQRQLQYEQ